MSNTTAAPSAANKKKDNLGAPNVKKNAVNKEEEGKSVTIRLSSYYSARIENAVQTITEAAKSAGAKVIGPVPLPNNIKRFTILRSPHVYKVSRDQYEMREHSRLIRIEELDTKSIDALRHLPIPVGVSVYVKT